MGDRTARRHPAGRGRPRRRPAGRRRLGRRLAGATALALALLATTAVAVPAGPGPAEAAGPRYGAEPARPLLGVVGPPAGGASALVRLDPWTLRALPGPRLRLPSRVASHSWSPDRSLLALGDADDDVVHLVDPVAMRRLGGIRIGIVARAPLALAWLSPRRLAVVAGVSDDGSHLVLVDPLARRVLSRRQLAPADLAAAAAGRWLVLLGSPLERIGPARLLVMDDRGVVRSVELPGVLAGFQPPPDWDVPGAYGVGRTAALAADPAGGRAFVLAAGSPVAEVDLTSLRVTGHGLRQPLPLLRRLAHWLVPPVQAKLGAGSQRAACWLGEGRLALWGGEVRVLGDSPAELRAEDRPLGLSLVDTRDWTVRPLPAFAGLDVVGLGRHGDRLYAEVEWDDGSFARVVASLDGDARSGFSRGFLPYLVGDGRHPPC
jgi:hypothetical protein